MVPFLNAAFMQSLKLRVLKIFVLIIFKEEREFLQPAILVLKTKFFIKILQMAIASVYLKKILTLLSSTAAQRVTI